LYSANRSPADTRTTDIAKYFGNSTGDGIQFQFRGIKKDADKIRSVANEGGDPNTVPLVGLGAAGAPAQPTPSKGRTRGTPSTAGGRKRKVKDESPVKVELTSDDEFSSAVNYDEADREETPSKRTKRATTPKTGTTTPGRKNGAPSRRAASKAANTIAADAAASNSADDDQQHQQYVAPASIFGDGNGTSGMAALHGGSMFDSIGVTDPFAGAPSAYHNGMNPVSNEEGEI
jgi:hypothetical protein